MINFKKKDKEYILPTAVSLLLTENCNLACKYCFEKHTKHEMTSKVAIDAIEWIYSNAKTNIKNGYGQQELNVLLFGGEPTLRVDLIEQIFEKLSKYVGIDKNITVTASMITNATIMTDAMANIFKKYKTKFTISVQLSVDGIRKVQDHYRITVSGKGSFELVEKNIDRWKEIFKDDLRALNIHGCCNRFSLPYLFENYKFFREQWGLKSIWFMPIHSEEWLEEDVKIYKDQLNAIADYLLKVAKSEHSLDIIYEYAPLDKSLSLQFRNCFNSKSCGAGYTFVTINYKGEIFPCHHIYFNDPENETKCGDIYNGIDNMKRLVFLEYDNSDFTCSEEDPDCNCYGCYRCLGDNYTKNGSIFSNIRDLRCKMSKIERQVQNRINTEVTNMGLLNRNINSNKQEDGFINQNCLCDSRGITNIDANITNTKNDMTYNEKLELLARSNVEIMKQQEEIKDMLKLILKNVL